MALVNSFAKFYSAVYPAEADVLATAPAYGDAANVLQGTATTGGNVSASDIYDYFTANNRQDTFRATGFNTVAPHNASIAAIKAKTDSLTFTVPNQVDANAITGSGSGIYSLTVTCEDSSGSAVANVRVNIDGTTTTLVTNSSGQCVFNLDAGDYSLVASPPSEFNTPADTSVTVSADGSQTITLTQASTSGSAGWVG